MADRTVRVRVLADLPGYGTAMRGGAADTALLGEAAAVAGREVTALGVQATTARGGLTGLGASARGGAAGVAEAEGAAVAASRGVRAVGAEAEASRGPLGRIGSAARTGLGSVRSAAASAWESMSHLGTLLAGGAVLYGLHDIVHLGNEYTDSMNKFLEVTRASGAQMNAAGAEAQALGADMKLPSASAAEAADAMVELAKAGLSAQDAVKAARGTIQLSAAARTDVATAAKIEGDVMDQFSLKSSEAAHVADVLANTANSASGELMDIYYAMKYVGPIAHTMGISIQDTATAVGLLGKSGIIGETAGTALRSALVNMAKPTKQAAEGLKQLGIDAFDSSGNFKGLQYLITQLGDAQEHMSTKSFTAAAAMAFGKPALAAMVALAHQGGPAFEQFGQQVGRVGGSASLAAAESKGLGGAMRGLGKQISSAFLQIYLAIAPGLEGVTRGLTSAVSSAIPAIKGGIRIATDLWDIYGPTVEKKLGAAVSVVEAQAKSLATAVGGELVGLSEQAVPLVVKGFDKLGAALHTAEADAKPVAAGLHAMYDSAVSSGGALQVLSGRLQVSAGLMAGMVSSLGGAGSVLKPLGQDVGALTTAFAKLPGWLQLSVLGMIAMRPFRPQIQSMQQSIGDFGRSGVAAFRGLNASILEQQQRAAEAGATLGRFGGAIAVLETHSPGIAAMGTAFRGVYEQLPPTAGALERVGGGIRGLGAAAGAGAILGLKSAASGLLGVMGGPWGLAMTGAMALLDYFAQKQAAAKKAVADFTATIKEDSGVLGDNTRALVAQKLQESGALDTAKKYGVTMGTVIDAVLGNTAAHDSLNATLQKNATTMRGVVTTHGEIGKSTLVLNGDAMTLKDTIDGQNGSVNKAAAAYDNQAAALRESTTAVTNATDPTSRLQALIKTLANNAADADTKARALHDALTLLSGGELDVQAAVAQQNQSILDLNSTYKDGVDQAKGYGSALLQVDGSLNTSSENGQSLWTKLQALNEQTAGAAQSTYDYARANGVAIPDALKKAEGAMSTSWDAAVAAAQQFGLTADQAKTLAAQMGFIPSNLSIVLDTPGMDDTQKQLLYVQGLAGHIPAGASIKVSALTDDAVKQLTAIGIQVTTLPGGRQMEITAPTDKAQAALDDLIAKKIPQKRVDVDVPTARAIEDLESIKIELASVPNGHSIVVESLTVQAEKDLSDIGYTVKHLPDGTVRVFVPTDGVRDSTNRIQADIDGITGSTVHVTVYQDYVVTGSGKALPLQQADGGIVHFARGGITAYASGGESHIAQIARPGAMRLWAEPETGGEAYIPLAPAKRHRSMDILGTVAGRFGYQLTPAQPNLIPARSLIAPSTSGSSYDQSRTNHLHLYGAKQSWAEQRADLMRHLEFVS